jgi:TrmH family RNA methyltransferase
VYTVIFLEPETPGNVGAIARAMKNFGLKKLVLVNPKCELDDTAYARAMRGKDILRKARAATSLKEIKKKVDFLVGTTAKPCSSEYNLNRQCIAPGTLAEKLSEIDGNIGILLGREDSGLSNEELSLCDIAVHIPASPKYSTLNVSHAAVILFYELAKIKSKKVRPASRKQKEVLEQLMAEVVNSLGGIRNKKQMLLAWRRILSRSLISGREAHTISGLFSEIKKKLKKKVF